MSGSRQPRGGLFSNVRRASLAAVTAFSLAVGAVTVPYASDTASRVAGAQAQAQTQVRSSAVGKFTPFRTGEKFSFNLALNTGQRQDINGTFEWPVSVARNQQVPNMSYPAEAVILLPGRAGSVSLGQVTVYSSAPDKFRVDLSSVCEGRESECVTWNNGPTLQLFGAEGTKAAYTMVQGGVTNQQAGYSFTPAVRNGAVSGTVTPPQGMSLDEVRPELAVEGEGQYFTPDVNYRTGAFSLPDLKPGNYRVRVAQSGLTKQFERSFTVRSGQAVNLGELRLDARVGALAGEITVSNKVNLANANPAVTLVQHGTNRSFPVTVKYPSGSNQRGELSATGLRPGTYTLKVAATERTAAKEQRVEIQPDATARPSIALDVLTSTIELRVPKSSMYGNPSSTLNLTVTRFGGTPLQQSKHSLDTSQVLSFTADPGDYEISFGGNADFFEGKTGRFTARANESTSQVLRLERRLIEGYVRAPGTLDGQNPLQGLRVIALRNGSPKGDAQVNPRTGQYVFTGLDNGTYTLRVSGDFVETQDYSVTVNNQTIWNNHLRVRAFKQSAVQAKVTVGAGQSFNGGKLSLVDGSGSTRTFNLGASARDASFAGLAHGDYTLTLFNDRGLKVASQSVRLLPGQTREVTLDVNEEFTTITGRVVDTEGAPVSGAKVTIENRTGDTDRNGYYTISGVPRAGNLTISVGETPTSYGQTQSFRVDGELSANRIYSFGTSTVELKPVRLNLNVLEDETTTQIAGVSYRLVPQQETDYRTPRQGLTDDQGFAEIVAYPGAYTLELVSPKDAQTGQPIYEFKNVPRQLDLRRSENVAVFAVPRDATLTGVVRDDANQPVANARVEVVTRAAKSIVRTDAQGRYQVSVPPYQVRVAVLDSGTHQASAQQTVTVLPTRSHTADLAVRRKDGAIEGIVKLGQEPAAGVVVTLVGEGVTLTDTTDAAGAYRFATGLRPGSYTVTIPVAEAYGGESKQVTVRSNGSERVDFDLVYNKSTLVVSVGFGKELPPVTDATLTLRRVVDGKPLNQTRTMTYDPQRKAYVAAGLDHGTYQVHLAETSRYTSNTYTATLQPGKEEKSNFVAIFKNGQADVEVVDDAGQPIDGIALQLKGKTDVKEYGVDEVKIDARVENGKLVFESLRPGVYSVNFPGTDAYGGASVDNFRVEPSETARPKLTLRRNDGSATISVTDDISRTIAGAEVKIEGRGEALITDEQGRVQTPNLRPGTYNVEVSNGASHQANTATLTIDPGVRSTFLEVRLAREAASISGVVVDDKGASVADAVVAVVGRDGAQQTTNADGTFTFTGLPEGGYTLEVKASEKHAGKSVTVQVSPGQRLSDVEIVVSRDLKLLNGTVTDEAANQLAHVTVSLRNESGEEVATATTNGAGAFSFEQMEPGTYTVSVAESATHNAAESAAFTVELGKFIDNVTLQAQRKPGSVAGTVSFSNDKPVAGAEITLQAQDGTTIPLKINADNTISQGEIPAGRYSVQVKVPKHFQPVSVAAIEVNPGQETALGEIAFVSTVGAVEGQVRDGQNRAVEGVSAELIDGAGQRFALPVDASGNFALSEVPVGEYTLHVTAPEAYEEVGAQTVRIAPSATTTIDPITLVKKPELPKTGSVVVNIVDEQGKPLPEITVRLQSQEPGGTDSAISTKASGSARWADLQPGKYTFSVNPPAQYEVPASLLLDVTAGKETTIPQLTLKQRLEEVKTGEVRGRVLDAATQDPLPQTTLVLQDSEGAQQVVSVQRDGTFTQDSLLEGTYTLIVGVPAGYKPFNDELKFTVAAGNPQIINDILLEKIPPKIESPHLGGVQGQVVKEDGFSSANVEVIVRKLAGDSKLVLTDEGGIFSVADLEPGEYVVEVVAPEGYASPRFVRADVLPDKVTAVHTIKLQRLQRDRDESLGGAPGTINGWLVDDAGDPIKGAQVTVTGTVEDSEGKTVLVKPALRMDRNGFFSTDKLEPGKYEVNITTPEGWPDAKGWPKEFTVTRDKPTNLGVIEVEAPRSEIKGKVDDGSGKPIEGVVVTVTDARGNTRVVEPDANGEFIFDKAVPGTSTVEVFTPEGVRDVDPIYAPTQPGQDIALPGVHLTKKSMVLEKRVRGWDADEPGAAPVYPVGTDLVYGFVLRNVSDVTLQNIVLDDPLIPDERIVKPEGWNGSLEPGEYVVFSATVKPGERVGDFNNVASAYGFTAAGEMVAALPNNAFAKLADMSLEKKVNARYAIDPNAPVIMGVDEDLYFTYEVVNRGSAPMYNVELTDIVYEGDAESFDPENPGKGVPMEIEKVEGWDGTLMPGERVIIRGSLPPLKPGTRHHNAAQVRAELPEKRKEDRLITPKEEGLYGEDPAGFVVVSPKKNIYGNAHIIVSEGQTIPQGAVSGIMWEDKNGNGSFDAAEGEGIGGVKLSLVPADNSVAQTEVSDGEGKFAFAGSPAGQYRLEVENPGGYLLKNADSSAPASAEKGSKLVTPDFAIKDNEFQQFRIELVKKPEQQPVEQTSSLGRCVTETSSASNPAIYLIPVGLVVAALAGGAVLFEDQFNAVIKQVNAAMPQLALERPEWMNQISRQLNALHPAAAPAVLALGLLAIGALSLGLAYAACEAGPDQPEAKQD